MSNFDPQSFGEITTYHPIIGIIIIKQRCKTVNKAPPLSRNNQRQIRRKKIKSNLAIYLQMKNVVKNSNAERNSNLILVRASEHS